ncbi:type I-F CRISPR-associated endoribonuclease Cas6/Csy4 [Rappaport israeli]|uniref:type I-F CRISPR-associated endoribonuclease Cas6/Csy4 n=1 Tax=Rappaport israeli TaxID=1839807 RepID=UPI00093063E1|nr:type I-F CRISPR-associated endoribonuclease Cas6/Csy4 [Rappaport israeli]
MTVYQEITLIANADISPYFLWSKVMTQLHIALANIKNKHGINTIGISFPNYRYEQKNGKTFASLGDKVRIFAQSEDDLDKLALPLRLAWLIDYIHLTTIKPVGNKATAQVIVKRYRPVNFEKQVREFAEFRGISLQEARQHCLEYKKPNQFYPYITLTSQTNEHPYQLSIWQEKIPLDGFSDKNATFNSYGLNNMSSNVALPHW